MFNKASFGKAGFLAAILLSAVAAFGGPADLSVSSSDIAISPDPPTDGAPLMMTVTVHNIGTKASKACQVSAKLSLDGKKVFSQKLPLPAIQPGATADVAFSLGTRAQGTYGMTVKVDPGNTVSETSESNNKTTASMTVVAAGEADVGQTAAAAYQATYDLTRSVTSAQKILARPGTRAEETSACTKAGAADVSYVLDTVLRPLSATIDSPAAGYTECEDWISEDTSTTPPTGLYILSWGHMRADVTGYLSDNPFDPGFFLPASAVLKLGDGNPGADALPDWSYSDMYDYLDSGSVQRVVFKTESWDMTANVTVSGYSVYGYPTAMTLSANGTGTFTDNETGRTCVVTLTDFTFHAAYSGAVNDLTITLTLDGTAATSFPDDPTTNYSITYHDLTLVIHQSSLQVTVAISGSMDISGLCVNGEFTFASPTPVLYVYPNYCPSDGRIIVTSPLGNATLVFNADGSLSVDNGNDGTIDHTYASCLVAPQSPCE